MLLRRAPVAAGPARVVAPVRKQAAGRTSASRHAPQPALRSRCAAAPGAGAGGAGAGDGSGAGGAADLAVDFSGTWVKDHARSDSLEPAADLVQLNPLVRRGLGLIRGVQIAQGGGRFVFSVLSAVPLIKITEDHPLSGERAEHPRRDMRPGTFAATVDAPSPQKLRIRLAWGDPYPGSGEDLFSLPAPDELLVEQVTRARGAGGEEREVRYTSVYTRQG